MLLLVVVPTAGTHLQVKVSILQPLRRRSRDRREYVLSSDGTVMNDV